MSAVYKGRLDGDPVAIKVFSPSAENKAYATTALAQFEHEREALRRLNHSGVVRYIAHGNTKPDEQVHEALPYLIMEFVPGITLEQRYVETPRIKLEEVLRVIDALLEIVQALHVVGLIHRDIKPSNIMLLPDGGVKLLDLGSIDFPTRTRVSVIANAHATSEGYASDAQKRGDEPVPEFDVFACAGVLLRCLSAAKVPRGSVWHRIANRARSQDADDAILSATELRRELSDVRRPGRFPHATHWRIRTRIGVGAGVVAGLLAVMLLIGRAFDQKDVVPQRPADSERSPSSAVPAASLATIPSEPQATLEPRASTAVEKGDALLSTEAQKESKPVAAPTKLPIVTRESGTNLAARKDFVTIERRLDLGAASQDAGGGAAGGVTVARNQGAVSEPATPTAHPPVTKLPSEDGQCVEKPFVEWFVCMRDRCEKLEHRDKVDCRSWNSTRPPDDPAHR